MRYHSSQLSVSPYCVYKIMKSVFWIKKKLYKTKEYQRRLYKKKIDKIICIYPKILVAGRVSKKANPNVKQTKIVKKN